MNYQTKIAKLIQQYNKYFIDIPVKRKSKIISNSYSNRTIALVVAGIVGAVVLICIIVNINTPKTENEPSYTELIEESPEETNELIEEDFYNIDDLLTVNTAEIELISANPENTYINSWQSQSYSGPFTIGGEEETSGFGIYVLSSSIEGENGQASIVMKVPKNAVGYSCSIAAENNWCFGSPSDYGTYKVQIDITNEQGNLIYTNSYGYFDYENLEYIEFEEIPEESNTLTITLEETKGSQGTLNVVLGDFKFYVTEKEEITNDNTNISIEDVFDENGFIFADSNVRYLSDNDIIELIDIIRIDGTVDNNLLAEILGFARNEIFARYGNAFNTEKYINHYYQYGWYTYMDKTPDIGFESLNEVEIANVNYIQGLEERLENGEDLIF